MSIAAYDLMLDDQGDLDMSSGDLVITSGIDAVRQSAMSRLRFFKGEWFMDELIGVDYWGTILVKNPSLPVVRELLLAEILASPGIASVQQLSLDLDASTRELTTSFKAVQDDGTLLVADGLLLWSAQ